MKDPKFKLMIQADSAEELKALVLEAAQVYSGPVVFAGVDCAEEGSDKTVLAAVNEAAQEIQQKGPMVENGRAWVPTPGGPGNSYMPIPVEDLPKFQAEQAAKNAEKEVERDSKGMPFDIRIHAATRTTNKDGTWKYKRSVPDVIVADVEKEIIARHGRAPKAVDPAMPSAPVAPLGSPVGIAPFAGLPNLPAIPAAPVPTVNVQMPGTIAPVAAPVQAYNMIPGVPAGQVKGAYDLASFRNQLPMIMMGLVNEKKIDQGYIQQLKDYFQVQEIWQVAGDEIKSKTLFENFAAAGLITRVG